MEKIINKLINDFIKGTDIYHLNGSTWLIFTDNKQWVIELTETKTLWYNYNFFKSLFSFLSMDVVENQHYITKWVEDNIIGGVRHIDWCPEMNNAFFDDAIKNGVKETKTPGKDGDILSTIEWMEENKSKSVPKMIDDIIQNGVKETKACNYKDPKTGLMFVKWNIEVDRVIETGIKETKSIGKESPNYPTPVISHIIKNGVKETKAMDERVNTKNIVGEVIKLGVKDPRI